MKTLNEEHESDDTEDYCGKMNLGICQTQYKSNFFFAASSSTSNTWNAGKNHSLTYSAKTICQEIPWRESAKESFSFGEGGKLRRCSAKKKTTIT